jgi:hypothetical protein
VTEITHVSLTYAKDSKRESIEKKPQSIKDVYDSWKLDLALGLSNCSVIEKDENLKESFLSFSGYAETGSSFTEEEKKESPEGKKKKHNLSMSAMSESPSP